MKTYFYLSFIVLFFSLTANSQITKGNWMVGGDGSYSSFRSRKVDGSGKFSPFSIRVNPNIGYFFKDKMAVGVSLEMGFGERDFHVLMSPFFRYYFLKQDKIINIFSSINAGYGKRFNYSFNNNYNLSKLGIKTGSVIFLNENIGLEVFADYSLNYYQYANILGRTGYVDYIKIGVGFQIHLENNR